MELSKDLTYLLFSEYVRCMDKEFLDQNDRDLHISTQIYNFGLKPGFAFAAQLCYDGQNINSPSEAGKFISTVLSPKIFDVRASYEYIDNVLTITYKTLPETLKCLISPDEKPPGARSQWFKYYTNFISGVFAGALSHFGYKVFSQIESELSGALVFKFTLEPLEGAWTFCATMYVDPHRSLKKINKKQRPLN